MKRRSALGLMAGAELVWTRREDADTLCQSAPELDVLVLDRDPVFHSLPLSNP